MKNILLIAVFAVGSVVQAQTKQVFAGSDTLAGAITDALIAAGMNETLSYAGGGSGVGEKNLVAGDQGIAPMSREIKPEALAALNSAGSNAVPHVLGLDGVSVYVNKGNGTPGLDVQTVTKIFNCELTRWEQVAGSKLKGEIHVFRRDDSSGTTDAFKSFTGIKNFGACVAMVAETADISEKTSKDPLAVGYAGLSGKVDENRAVPLSSKVGAKAVAPTTATIRNGTYPFTRKLYIYEVTGARHPSASEKAFLDVVTDRSFMDPIMQAHEFITLN